MRLKNPVEYFKMARWKISRYQDGQDPKVEMPSQEIQHRPRSCPSGVWLTGKTELNGAKGQDSGVWVENNVPQSPRLLRTVLKNH